jgi:hypothetical protein
MGAANESASVGKKGVKTNVLGNFFSAQLSMKWDTVASSVYAHPSRVEALGLGQDSLGSGRGWGDLSWGKALHGYFRASRWVQT